MTQPAAALSETTSSANVKCYGGTDGTAGVSVSGGTSAYTYSWSPSGGTGASATGLTAGSYTVTITDAAGCTLQKTITITEPPVLAATTSQVDVKCFGATTGSATVSVSGGTGTYTYLWSPSGGTGATASGLGAGNYSVLITDAAGCTLTKNFTITQPAAALSATTSSTNVKCFGGTDGTAGVSVSGGTSAYTYSWSPSGGTGASATGLTAGSYTVTITDAAGCTLQKTITITEPPVLAATTSQVDVKCFGATTGSATVSVSGGTGTYTYLWSPSGGTGATASGLGAGNYSVLITDAAGCTLTKNFTITQPAAALSATTSSTNVKCFGGTDGTAGVSVSGGTSAYTHSWSPSRGTGASATGLTAGSYTGTITDAAGCTLQKTITITEPPVLAATTSQVDVKCFGATTGSATVSVSGGTGTYTYLWSPSGGTGATASGLGAGNYSVLITDAAGCTLTKNFTITQPAAALSATTSSTNVKCFGGTDGTAGVSVSGGTSAYTYSWSPSGGTGASATGLTAGSYTVTITDAAGCTLQKTITITEPPVLAATTSQVDVKCFGATTGSATVSVSGGTGTYTYLWSPSGGTGATASGLGAGKYSGLITDAAGCTLTKNFTITQPAAALSATTSSTNVKCFGGTDGTAGVSVSGGTSAYTYSWSPSGGTGASATGLTAGSYTVTITDAAGCTLQKTITITEPPVLAATTSQVDVKCFGATTGSATVSVSGGTGTYTYLWSPSGGTGATASGLGAGNYSVLITDAAGCTLTKNFTITQPAAALSATTSSTNVKCFGGTDGTAGVSVSGGTSAYTYSWSPSGGTGASATGLTAGSYTVTITDAAGCTLQKTITITEPPVLAATTSQVDVKCFGATTGSATVSVSGGTGTYTYLWSPSGGTGATASGLGAGNYSVLITDAAGCTLTKNFTITQPAAALSATTSSTNVKCFGGTDGTAGVSVSGGTSAYTYSWSPSGGTGASATGLTAGSYTVTITDAAGCTLQKTITITEPPVLAAVVLTAVDATCGQTNGSFTIGAVTGGVAPYTYSVDGSAFTTTTTYPGLGAGSHSVVVKDANGCSLTTSASVSNSSGPTAVVLTAVDATCGQTNGSFTIGAVTGGVAPYTYSVDGSAFTTTTTYPGLGAGSHSVVVKDANGCSFTTSASVSNSSGPTAVVLTAVDATCGQTNGSFTIGAVTGGVAPYTYSVDGSAFTTTTTYPGLGAGSHSVVVKDANGCSFTTSASVSNSSGPTAVVLTAVDATCGQTNG